VAEADALTAEVRDRYGALPPALHGLLAYAGLRLRAEAVGVAQVDLTGPTLHFRFAPQPPLPPESLVHLVRGLAGASLLPQGILRAPTLPGEDALTALGRVLEPLEAAARTAARA
jgi:transcription-repair coupling factor (superfamily II helicase)